MFSKKFILAVVFLLTLLVSDRLIGWGLKRLYFSQKVGSAGQLNYTMLQTKEDILILGNSRAQHHYNNKIISDSTSMSCYNGGLDGGYGIWLPYAITDAILKRYRPKLIIVEFNSAGIEYSKLNHEKLVILLPYKDSYEVCNDLVSQRGNFEKLKWVSSIYPFNSMIYSLITNRLFEKRLQHVKGFMPIQNKVITETYETTKISLLSSDSEKPDPLNINSLNSLMRLCKGKNVKLLFVNSPVYRGKLIQINKNNDVDSTSIAMIQNEGFQYVDFSRDKRMVSDPGFFADQNHLNEKGANFFSSLLINYIKSNGIFQAASK